jgi:hypothetical protein
MGYWQIVLLFENSSELKFQMRQIQKVLQQNTVQSSKTWGMTISKISNFELLTNESVIFASPENSDSVTLATIKSYLKNARVVYERPSKYSTADILIVVSD